MMKLTKTDIINLRAIIRRLDKQEIAMQFIYGSSAAYVPTSIRITDLRTARTLKKIYAHLTGEVIS